MAENLWLIPALPLAGAIINGTGALTGKLPRIAVHLVAVGVMLAAFVVSAVTVMGVSHGAPLYQLLYTWIPAGTVKVDAALMVDEITSVMILIITGVGSLIHLYSTGYRHLQLLSHSKKGAPTQIVKPSKCGYPRTMALGNFRKGISATYAIVKIITRYIRRLFAVAVIYLRES